MKLPLITAVAVAFTFAGNNAIAEPVSVEVLLTPEEQMKFEFADGSNHFVLAVRREGTAEGSGVFAGAAVTEFGWHDVNPPVSGDPQGYLEITTQDGDVAILHWAVKATFTKVDGSPTLFNSGVWKLVSGTGRFEDMHGVGSLRIVPRGGPNLFILEGEVGDKP
jgi:hypothetical protein